MSSIPHRSIHKHTVRAHPQLTHDLRRQHGKVIRNRCSLRLICHC